MPLPDLYLASASPRRRELLAQIGLKVEIVSISVNERPLDNEPPGNYVRRLALEKARAGLLVSDVHRQCPVLGADTAVVMDDCILGKPANKAEALAMLKQLSGHTHQVLSAVAVVGKDNLGQDRVETCISQSQVRFRRIDEKEYLAYWQTGEPTDKAGAYGIQGLAAIFIEHLEGSYSGVMGLPLFETSELLCHFGIKVLREDKGPQTNL